ncbi:MAG: BON domain-containing protein [Burkholderiaceae bacterium]
MIKQTTGRIRFIPLCAAAAAALLMAACGQHEDGLSEHVDAGLGKGEQTGASPAPAVATAATAAQLDRKASADAAERQQDAAITASIRAEFASDPALSRINIQVQTREGLVSLNGAAPDAATRDHATRLAATVKNVLSVDNHMSLPKA